VLVVVVVVVRVEELVEVFVGEETGAGDGSSQAWREECWKIEREQRERAERESRESREREWREILV